MLLIKNVKIVSCEKISEEQDVLIEDGEVLKIGKIPASAGMTGKKAEMTVINGNGEFLLPGIIDCHVHFRTPGQEYKEDFESGSKAALMGGVTTVLDMPNNVPPIFTNELLEKKRAIVSKMSLVDFGLYFGTNGENLDEIKKVKNVAGVKVYMNVTTGNLLITDPEVLQKLFKVKQRYALHAEGETFDLALKYLLESSNEFYLCHASLKREVDKVRDLKKNGNKKVFMEACPHHLFLNKEDREKHGGYCCVKPELASLEDQNALWEGLKDYTIDTIATDHAPHTKAEKESEKPAFGVPGVEFSLPLMLNEVSKGRLTLQDIVRLMSYNPAKIFGIKNKGEIKEGFDADLVLVDLNLEKEIKNGNVVSKCGWTPYAGRICKGWPVMTIRGGEVMMREGRIVGEGKGKEVEFG
ncbi:hypothetical protein A2272_06085 [Candidatus Peregrinibacteria bacterium RIFOXYA12_FULL_33_12]|nr:MAG: hypothetical protein A2263_03470 [Candidatus Peregrinibacteria bacterium RIFOXYA2_FULL_33_21]OGJ46790.1 MAG: hypothetical protein A2272_06085 [Candidatus Peregrinibacteria bacterium RIFOXYA12_FULL_33_12]OGJ51383.1 MAG: hypothetical protein A2307_02430 [Candidatus Peregrinibacteria bacterium RIFOXYB2_FULL_33_20]